MPTVKRRGRALTRGRITQTLGSLHDSSMEEVQVLDLDDLLEKEEEDELWERYKDLEPVYDGNPFVPDPSPEPPKAAPPFSSLPPSPGLVNFFGAASEPTAPTTWTSAPANINTWRSTVSHAPTPVYNQVPQFVNVYSTTTSDNGPAFPALTLDATNVNESGYSYNEKYSRDSFDTVRTLTEPTNAKSAFASLEAQQQKLQPPRPPRRRCLIVSVGCCFFLLLSLVILALIGCFHYKYQFQILNAKLTMSGSGANFTSTANSLSVQALMSALLVNKRARSERIQISLSHGYAQVQTDWMQIAANEHQIISQPVSLLYDQTTDKGWQHLKRLLAICQRTKTADGKQGITAAPPVVWNTRIAMRIFDKVPVSFSFDVDVVTECPLPSGASSDLLNQLTSDQSTASDQDPLPAAKG